MVRALGILGEAGHVNRVRGVLVDAGHVDCVRGILAEPGTWIACGAPARTPRTRGGD